MTRKKIISTAKAPSAFGAYSQAVKANGFLFISGQIPLVPESMKVLNGTFEQQVNLVLNNLKEIIEESGSSLGDIVKINVYLKDLSNFDQVNQCMEKFFEKPFPARAAVEVSRLPKDAEIEMDAIVLSDD